MKIWGGFVLAAVLSLACQQQQLVLAKDICQDAGVTPTPTLVTPAPTTTAPAPVPSTNSPVTQSPPVPVPAPSTNSPVTQSPPTPTPTTVAPTPEPTTIVPTPEPTTTAPGVGCGAQLKQIFYHGFDIDELPLKTSAECCAACNANPKCKLYTHFYSKTTGVLRCLLKTAAGEKTNYGDSQSVVVVSAFANETPVPTPVPTLAPTPAPTPASAATCGVQLKQIYFSGYDISEFTLETSEECCTECAREPKCVLYTYFYSKATGVKRCLLKSAAGEKTNYGDSRSVVAVSAYITRPTPEPTPAPVTPEPTPAPAPSCGPQLKQIYFHGNIISEFTLETPEECCAECGRDPKCIVYTYFHSKTTGVKRCLTMSTEGEKTNYGDSQSVVAVSARVTHPTPPPPTPTPAPAPTPEPVCTIPNGDAFGSGFMTKPEFAVIVRLSA
ncbi:hypothetical protein PybrP1_010147 [[Pythium] brassicae (nom. inval.)]|nr:hypothetical protein PybrP1_010147 [[Pythium] brassicae (nom. inval.)]